MDGALVMFSIAGCPTYLTQLTLNGSQRVRYENYDLHEAKFTYWSSQTVQKLLAESGRT